MAKTNYFIKVEELIELRKELRSMTGVIESIGETIRLWQKCDKLDEYWDHCWNYKSEEINSYVANRYADIDEVSILAENLVRGGSYFPRFDTAYFVDRREKLIGRMLGSTRPFKHKLMKLQRMTLSARANIIDATVGQWERWIRRDAVYHASLVSDVIVRLVLLKAGIEKHWMLISKMPSMKERPEPDAAVK